MNFRSPSPEEVPPAEMSGADRGASHIGRTPHVPKSPCVSSFAAPRSLSLRFCWGAVSPRPSEPDPPPVAAVHRLSGPDPIALAGRPLAQDVWVRVEREDGSAAANVAVE